MDNPEESELSQRTPHHCMDYPQVPLLSPAHYITHHHQGYTPVDKILYICFNMMMMMAIIHSNQQTQQQEQETHLPVKQVISCWPSTTWRWRIPLQVLHHWSIIIHCTMIHTHLYKNHPHSRPSVTFNRPSTPPSLASIPSFGSIPTKHTTFYPPHNSISFTYICSK